MLFLCFLIYYTLDPILTVSDTIVLLICLVIVLFPSLSYA